MRLIEVTWKSVNPIRCRRNLIIDPAAERASVGGNPITYFEHGKTMRLGRLVTRERGARPGQAKNSPAKYFIVLN